MHDFTVQSEYLALGISLLAYLGGERLYKKFPIPLFNPLLIAILITMLFLETANLDYQQYCRKSAILNYLLTPATICLALPLYEKLSILKRYPLAILAGIVSGTLTSLCVILAIAVGFQLSHSQYITLLPKSITSALGIGVATAHGGDITLTVSIIIFTGLLGHIFAVPLFRLFRIRSRVAQGVAIGTAAHAIGTAKAMELGKITGAVSTLSLIVTGVLSVFLIEIFAKLW